MSIYAEKTSRPRGSDRKEEEEKESTGLNTPTTPIRPLSYQQKKKGKSKDPLDDSFSFSRLPLRRRTSTKESLTGKKVLLS